MAKATIFIGSFLAFALELMVGRALLPNFGSSSSVWVTCLCVFQILLIAGYFYGAIKPRRTLHTILVVLAAFYTFFIAPGMVVKIGDTDAFSVIATVLATATPAFVLLSANATIVQNLTGGIYRLYAWSNLGSFAGLIAYSVILEPFVAVSLQWKLIGAAICFYAVMLSRILPHSASCSEEAERTGGNAVSWFLLSATGCMAMTSSTSFITSDIASLPLVWAVILGLYLLSWVIAFGRYTEKILPLLMVLGIVSTMAAALVSGISKDPANRFLSNAVAVSSFLLFGLSAVHGWLYVLRPSPCKLGVYYLVISVGGAAGGVFASIVAPLVFRSTYEYPISLVAVSIAAATWLKSILRASGNSEISRLAKCSYAIPCIIAVVLGWNQLCDTYADEGKIIHRERGFYGVMTVREKNISSNFGWNVVRRTLFNGKTSHGFQVIGAGLDSKPTMYYSLNGGGIAFTNHPSYCTQKPMKVGMVGLGVGTLAVYGRKGDTYRFYEISPEDIAIATNEKWFTFLRDSAATVEIRQGDARLELEKDWKDGEKFDILVIDAYSGDAVPTHLITKEAFHLYDKLMHEDGIIAVHLSNWHMNLWPHIKAAGREIKRELFGTSSGAVIGEFAAATDWVFMTRQRVAPKMPNCCSVVDWQQIDNVNMLTDDCGSLLHSLNFNFCVPVKKGR